MSGDGAGRRDLQPHLVPPERRALVLPAGVLAALPPEGVVVFTVPDDASDTVVLRHRRGGVDGFAAAVSLGSRRLDVNGAVRALLGAKKASFADRDAATGLTGMAFGGITAFGLPAGWRLLVDAAVMERGEVVMGAGVRTAKLLVRPAALAALPGAEVAALTL